MNGSFVFGAKLLPNPSSKPPKPVLFSSNVVANCLVLSSLCVPLLKPCDLSLNGSALGSYGKKMIRKLLSFTLIYMPHIINIG